MDSSTKKPEHNTIVEETENPSEEGRESEVETLWNSKSIYRAWLALCFCTGPVSSMTKSYAPAVIQSIARSVGHTATGGKCGFKGNDCYVRLGAGDVHFTSYVLYVRAISTALEGVVAIFLMGIADYGNYRKWILIFSIVIYGIFALPFAALTLSNYPTLKAVTALYTLLVIDDAVYQILEGSYIPLFMRATSVPSADTSEDARRKIVLARGSKVSVMGLFLGNVGAITALLIGVIISYSRGTAREDGYHNFLLAITIAGAVTVVFAAISSFFVPTVKNTRKKPKGEWLVVLTIKRFVRLLKDIQNYPHAFLYCVSWVIWNVSYSNFLSVFGLLFRSTLGLGASDAQFTVFSFISVIVACIGSLSWMFLYPRLGIRIKYWGFLFLGVQAFANFWGCLGISKHVLAVGFKNNWEFWVFEILFGASGSSLRSLNRTVYSTLLPEGDEAQYFGLEIMLGVATGWIGNLVNAVIQDRTGNDRYPFLPNLFLCLVSAVLYWRVDFDQGMRDAEKLIKTVSSYQSRST